jgi:uncharacterized protein (TIGR02996 family)
MDERVFLQALRASPRDEGLRLAYSDWLEEQGDSRAEFLRLDLQLARRRFGKGPTHERRLARWKELRGTLDPAWVARVARATLGLVKRLSHVWTPPDNAANGLGYSVMHGGEGRVGGVTTSEVETALRSLDGGAKACLYLQHNRQSEAAFGFMFWPCLPILGGIPGIGDPPHYYPGCDCLFFLGSRWALMMIGCLMEGIFRYCNPTASQSQKTVWTGGPGYIAPECEVCSDFERALDAARFFYYHGRLQPELPWRAEPAPWQVGATTQPEAESA